MKLDNNYSKSEVANVKNDVYRLSGGFGGGGDAVGSSYTQFYSDSYRLEQEIETAVSQVSACCATVHSVDVDALCKAGNRLIEIEKSYPKV